MTFSGAFALILSMLIQAGSVSTPTGDVFSPAEKAQLERTNSINGRIKVYQAASVRIQRIMQAAMAKGELDTIPDSLKLWTSLLAKSLEDIQANIKSKKKPRSLINYEIQVRKQIADTKDLKTRAPIEQQDVFDSCIAQAEAIRKKFVEILFKQSG